MWKARKIFCNNCKRITVHAYDASSHKGKLTKIIICKTCEGTAIIHKYKSKKFVVR